MKHNRKLKNQMGKDFSMNAVDRENHAPRPGEWKDKLRPKSEEKIDKREMIPIAVQNDIVQQVADGRQPTEIENELGVYQGYVRRVLIRRFGSVEQMKKALESQCLENAIALNEYGIQNIQKILPSQALVGAKIMVDAALALGKSKADRPEAVDFELLSRMGETIERIEKVVEGKVVS